MDQSKFDRSSFDEVIGSFDHFVANTNDIDPNIHLFRPKGAPSFYLASDELKQAMESAGITTCRFVEADGWDGNTLFSDIVWDPNKE